MSEGEACIEAGALTQRGITMTLALLLSLAISVAALLITIRYYERRVEVLQDDLDYAVALLAADDSTRIADLSA